MSSIGIWQVTQNKIREIHVANSSSLDGITRNLPAGYYSTFRTYDKCTRVLGLSAHLRRLPDVDASALRRSLRTLLEPFRPGEARVRAVQTYKGQVYIAIEPLKPLPPDVYEKGVRVETTTIHRESPRIKSTAFIQASEAERRHITRRGLFEALLVKNGKILEGMTSNFFYVVGRDTPSGHIGIPPTLGTAQRNILLGVTRTMVIRAARGRGVEVRYRALELSQLPAVKEAFITSSSRGIIPVVQIDGIQVGQGRPGEVTRMLMSGYEGYIMKHAEKI